MSCLKTLAAAAVAVTLATGAYAQGGGGSGGGNSDATVSKGETGAPKVVAPKSTGMKSAKKAKKKM